MNLRILFISDNLKYSSENGRLNGFLKPQIPNPQVQKWNIFPLEKNKHSNVRKYVYVTEVNHRKWYVRLPQEPKETMLDLFRKSEGCKAQAEF